MQKEMGALYDQYRAVAPVGTVIVMRAENVPLDFHLRPETEESRANIHRILFLTRYFDVLRNPGETLSEYMNRRRQLLDETEASPTQESPNI